MPTTNSMLTDDGPVGGDPLDDGITPPAIPPDDDADKAAKEADMAKRLASVEQNAATTAVLQRLSSDPQIMAILQARAQGRTVEVVDKAAKPPVRDASSLAPLPSDEPVDLNALDNAGLVRHLTKVLSGSIEQIVTKRIDEVVTPLGERVGSVQSAVEADLRSKIGSAIDVARKRFRDFDDVRPEMVDLNKANPGLNVTELYMLAKMRRGEVPLSEEIETERPGSSTAQPRPRTRPVPRGRQGFSQIIGEALEQWKP